MGKIRFIYFDLGNVLLKFSVRRLLHQVAELAEVSEVEARAVLFDDRKYLAFEKGEIDGKEYFAHICHGFNKSLPSADLLTATNNIFWVNESILPLIRHLSKAFFPRGILSNIGPYHWQYLQDAFPRIWRLFPNHRIASYAVKAMKPYPEIYQIALEDARQEIPDLKPEEVFFIDDLEENVRSGAEFGFTSFYYTETDVLLETMKSLGLPVPEKEETP